MDTEQYSFKCLRCDRMTTPTDTHEQNQKLAVSEGWSWGKALLCPDCWKKVRDRQDQCDSR